MSDEITEEPPVKYDMKELSAKYDKIIDFLVEQKSVIDEFMKYLGNIDRRVRKIEDNVA